MKNHHISIKRVFEPASEDDGYRILVDRLWPRGLKKEEAYIDKWLKDIAPSTSLRKWFNHEPEKWSAFEWRYKEELKSNPATDTLIKIITEHPRITFIYAAANQEHNHAIVLTDFLIEIDKLVPLHVFQQP